MTRISVLCPTRGRPDFLKRSIESLDWRANHPDRVEYLLAVDSDDALPELAYPKRTRVLLAPERYGYGRLECYYNMLAEQAQGDWLFLWNDDAEMQTYGWDSVIIDQKPGCLWSGITGDPYPHCNPFPIWPAEWTRVLGHVSGYKYCDTWIQEMSKALGVQWHVPIEINHHQPDDATFSQGRMVNSWFGPPPNAIAADIAKLREYLEVT